MSDLEIPKYKGENLQTCFGNDTITIEDPQNPLNAYIESDSYVSNIEDMA